MFRVVGVLTLLRTQQQTHDWDSAYLTLQEGDIPGCWCMLKSRMGVVSIPSRNALCSMVTNYVFAYQRHKLA